MPVVVLTDDEWEEQRGELLKRLAPLLANTSNAANDVSSKLSAIVKAYPTSACTEALAQAIIDTIHSEPGAMEAVLQAVAPLLPEFDTTQIDWAGAEWKWRDVFTINYLELLETILFELQLHQKPRTHVCRDNQTLSCALLAGVMVKHGFMVPGSRTSALFALACVQTAKRGLEQVRAIALCLQLSAGGRGLVDLMEKERECGVEKVIEVLKKFKEEEYVTHPQGKELLEVGLIRALGCLRSDLSDERRTRLITRRRVFLVYTR
ncbi:hypothetical protein FA13DRAFT_1731281 [Coprinellus micaceus]|uniref:ARM repeat-containing protein n=1 Tax=Coprinellus micaceus TaxID=71717 RepID=A0A4Y7TF15_COPMI|nr:hypothetical protein FA13DRAFT_1731281 [Coprinellus micaceus]